MIGDLLVWVFLAVSLVYNWTLHTRVDNLRDLYWITNRRLRKHEETYEAHTHELPEIPVSVERYRKQAAFIRAPLAIESTTEDVP